MDIVRLEGCSTTFLLEVENGRLPSLAYWGDQLVESVDPLNYCGLIKAPVFQGGLDSPYQLNIFPEAGTGFRGSPALIAERDGKNWVHSFNLDRFEKAEGGVVFYYLDDQASLELVLEIQLHGGSDVLARRTTLRNLGSSSYRIQYCASAALPLPSFCNEILKFHGCWTGEFMTRRQSFQQGIFQVENRTGRTSHEYFPAIICGQKDFSENAGRVYGLHLGWSGNFKIFAEQIPDGTKQLQCGELLLPGEGELAAGASYVSPWSYMSCSNTGLNGLSANFHRYFRDQIEPSLIKTKKRPVQFNTWEAVYFDHDLKKLTDLADKAAELGIERFVLDDGWSHKRPDDTRGLGDWWPDKDKYPNGITPLADHVKSLGMDFGLWIEPEMVNEKSTLYDEHPDWILGIEGLGQQSGRNQLVLDLTRPEVCDYLYGKIDLLLQENPIDYLKWDMNRILTEAGHNGYAAVSKQTKAFYALIDRIRRKYRTVEIETCASGGGRVDYEVLKRTERIWTSDSNDPFRRLDIQDGASLFFPPEVIGSHIGPELCHTTGRVTRLDFRALSSLFYHFGCEFDLLELTETEQEMLRKFINLHKDNRDLLHSGNYVRLEKDQSNGAGNRISYGVVSQDKNEALFCIQQTEIDDQSADRTVLFTGLAPEKTYNLEFLYPEKAALEKIFPGYVGVGDNIELCGSYLMEWGLPFYLPHPGTGVLIKLSSNAR